MFDMFFGLVMGLDHRVEVCLAASELRGIPRRRLGHTSKPRRLEAYFEGFSRHTASPPHTTNSKDNESRVCMVKRNPNRAGKSKP